MENLPNTSNKHERDSTYEQAALATLALARERGAGVLSAADSKNASDEAISLFLTKATESESDYVLADPVNVNLTDERFGPVEFAGENGVNAFRILEGGAILRTIQDKSASEMTVSEGDVVILDAQKETFFSLSSDDINDKLVVGSYRNKEQDVKAYNRDIALMSNDSEGRRLARAQEQRQSQKAMERWSKYTERQKNKQISFGRKVLDLFGK